MDIIIKHWPVLVALVAVSVSYGAQEVKIQSLEEGVKKLQEVQIQQAVIQTDIRHIRELLEELKDK